MSKTPLQEALLCVSLGTFHEGICGFKYKDTTVTRCVGKYWVCIGNKFFEIEHNFIQKAFDCELNKRSKDESKDKEKENKEREMNTMQHIDVTTLTDEQLSKFIKEAQQEVQQRDTNHFNQLVDNVLNAIDALAVEYPHCTCYVDVEWEDGDSEIDFMDIKLNKDMFNR